MKATKLLQRMLLALGHVMPGMIFLLLTRQAEANPTGMTVQSGQASATVNGSQLTITAGNNAVLNWQSFNIAHGESTVFNQPSATSVVWNNIGGQSASQIYGSLQANGVVVLLNSSGFYFGPNSYVSAAGLVVSTANCLPPQNAGGMWTFNGPPPLASIINYGEIHIGQSGSCYLIADKVENRGSIEAPGGEIGLASGQTVTLSERPDGRGMSMKVTLPQGSVNNYGTLLADAGTISLQAKVVNQDGFIQANSVRQNNGVIELVASDELNLGADSKILAHGDDSASRSAGGAITLKSDNRYSDVTGGEISVAGGANGGNGGTVEISAIKMPGIHTAIDGSAKAGSTGGKLLLDPAYIVLDTTGGDSAGGGTVDVGDNPGGTLDLNVNSAFIGFSKITLQAAYDISVADFTSWDLSSSTQLSQGNLVLEAGRNIIFGNASSLVDAGKWSVSLYAGVTDFAQKTVSPGAGSIYLNAFDPNNPGLFAFDPSGYIQMASGAINLVAGQDITVGTGRVTTTGGGSILAHALSGNIDTGAYAQGYSFNGGTVHVDLGSQVGGISSTAGGDVTLIAGGNVTSILPVEGGYVYDGNFTSALGEPNVVTAGSGAYGLGTYAPGNDFTVVAGGDVTGHYVEGNGAGRIFAGVKMDAAGNPEKDGAGNYKLGNTGSAGTDLTSPNLALSLINGGWNVTAAKDIILQEVRNPNGDFNTKAGALNHNFDYGQADYVKLAAGNLVQLGGSASLLPRLDGNDSVQVPVVYPGILSVSAGAGGIILTGDSTYNQLSLFPSTLGGLTINTTDGGSLVAGSFQNGKLIIGPNIFSLIVSDSGATQYTDGTFGLNDHAAKNPVHLNSENPIELNISGNIDHILLAASEVAHVTVGGDLDNSRFRGMNLSTGDTTWIHVAGDINNRSAFTTVDLTGVANAAVDLSLVEHAVPSADDPSIGTLLSSLYYNATTHVLTYQDIPGKTIGSVLQLLQNLTVQVYVNGVPQWTDALQTVPKTATVAVLNATAAQALLDRYNLLGVPPSGVYGYEIGGGGTFDITAHNLDLGTTAGIKSWGAGLYTVDGAYPLAALFNKGADIDVRLTGNLSLFSSAIASFNGGAISVFAGGQVDVGSSGFTVTALGARGIFTSSRSDVTVIANGNINVNGSRIAAYDGGNVTVESLLGNIDAGQGGSGFVVVTSFFVDPKTHVVSALAPTIPGSGILATTFPEDPAQIVGNVLVETPNGSIIASSGGIIQLPLNKAKDNDKAVVEALAGYELRDAGGQAVTAANLANGTAVKVSDGKDIDASGSGIIGENVVAKASGTFKGVVFGQNNVSLTSPKLTDLTVLGQNVQTEGSLGPSVTLIGTESVSTGSGGSGGATILSQNANGAGSSFAQGTAANATSSAASASDAAAASAATKSDTGAGDDQTKTKKPITLARKVSRVTVLLPGKN